MTNTEVLMDDLGSLRQHAKTSLHPASEYKARCSHSFPHVLKYIRASIELKSSLHATSLGGSNPPDDVPPNATDQAQHFRPVNRKDQEIVL